jgi:replicative DNA helicase
MKQDLIIQLEKIIGDSQADEKEIIHRLKRLLYEADLQSPSARPSQNIADLISQNLNLLSNGAPNENMVKTGFAEFDHTFGGFALGELVVIGGRPGMGKTQLMVNLALQIAQSYPILYFTYDLSIYSLSNRFLASASNIANDKILQKQLTPDELERLTAQKKAFSHLPLYINDSCNNSMSAFRAHCQQQIDAHGVKIIMVDYLQMMSASKHRNSRELEISYVSRELKNIAKDLNVCVIATSQLSRAVESRGGAYHSKHPQLSDLRESGAIEQDADKVIFVYRPAYYGITNDENGNDIQSLTELIIAKNRNGKLGEVKLQHNENFTNYITFMEYTNEFTFSEERLNELKNEDLF